MDNSSPEAPESTLSPFATEALGGGQEPAQAPEATAKTDLPGGARHRTVGNIIYDFGVFGTIAWAGVAVLSALSAHEANYGNNRMFGWLRSLNESVTNGLTSFLTKTLLKRADPETIKGYAKGTAMFATLGMGGNALAAPIKWMEDNRQKNAAKIDNALGTTPPDPALIEAEPKQTWKSVISGRLISWGTSYLAFLAMGPKITSQLSNWFGEKATAGWMKMKPASNEATVRRWAGIAAFDALFTVITATITYMASRSIARHDDEEKTTAVETPVAVPPSVSATPPVTISEDAPAMPSPHKLATRHIERSSLEAKPARTKPSSFAEHVVASQESARDEHLPAHG